MLDLLANARRLRGSDGFTFVELLVVILIIGLLAAIAIPTFLGQSARAKDAGAKADVRSAYTVMEACATADRSRYTDCDIDELMRRANGIPWSASAAPGTVFLLRAPTRDSFVLVGWSETNNVFAIARNAPDVTGGPGLARRCGSASIAGGPRAEEPGGCPGGASSLVPW